MRRAAKCGCSRAAVQTRVRLGSSGPLGIAASLSGGGEWRCLSALGVVRLVRVLANCRCSSTACGAGGLWLVRAICDAHFWRVLFLTSRGGAGSRVSNVSDDVVG